MKSESLVQMNISAEDFVRIEDIRRKAVIIDDLMEEGYDSYPRVSRWFREVLERETELYNAPGEGPEAELLMRLVKSVGADVHDEETRTFLGNLYCREETREKSALFYAIEICFAASLGNELDEVREWALSCLKSRGRLKNLGDTESYLTGLLKDREVPYYLKQEAVVVLGNRGSKEAVDALEQFARNLLGRQGKNPYERIVNNMLKESVAMGLGFTGKESVIRTLTALQIFTDDLDVKETARQAFEMIEMMRGGEGDSDVATGGLDDVFGVRTRGGGKRRKETTEEASSEQDIKKQAASMLKSMMQKLELAAAEEKPKRIKDYSGDYEFELTRLDDENIEISLYRTTELSIPDELKVRVHTHLKKAPVLECILEKREEELRVYGYIEETLDFEDIAALEVIHGDPE